VAASLRFGVFAFDVFAALEIFAATLYSGVFLARV
jgi:hypothetical protein